MSDSFETAIIEAASPKTDPQRLHVLSQWKHKDERSRLRQALASNPNSEEGLLMELAGEYPDEVIENPRFQLLLLGDETWWENVQPISMLRLLAALGPTAPKQARLDFFDELGCRLADTDPLDMNMEWHMSFTQEFTVEWEGRSDENAESRSTELETEEGEDDEDIDEEQLEEQEFSIDFCCIVDEVHCNLSPPAKLDDPLSCLEKLIDVTSKTELLTVLIEHGWEKDVDSCGDGYWEIENISPEEDGWEVSADLDGDGSGSVHITDPAGGTHEVEIDSPEDYGGSYLNPSLNEFIDMISSIFEVKSVSSEDLPKLLRQVIVLEKSSP